MNLSYGDMIIVIGGSLSFSIVILTLCLVLPIPLPSELTIDIEASLCFLVLDCESIIIDWLGVILSLFNQIN